MHSGAMLITSFLRHNVPPWEYQKCVTIGLLFTQIRFYFIFWICYFVRLFVQWNLNSPPGNCKNSLLFNLTFSVYSRLLFLVQTFH